MTTYKIKPEEITDKRVNEIKENLIKCNKLKMKNLVTISKTLEKQIPKKPNKNNKNESDILKCGWECPACKHEVGILHEYCSHCGQKLDWEETK